ncbi:MAG: chromate transporter [Porphyromonadaceae bacterium]|nr:chromate transporter [Porphyromonadaceae bacterium]
MAKQKKNTNPRSPNSLSTSSGGFSLYWQLFITFVRIGTFTFGGGYAMIPLIQEEIVKKKKWIEEREFIDMLAMAQSAPGVMAINAAIFIGYKIRGFKGSLITSFGSALPSFIIILLIAIVFTTFRENPTVESIFKGIRPAVVALIAAPLFNMGKAVGITRKTIIIPISAILLIWLLNISPVWIVLGAIVGGISYGLIKTKNLSKSN